MNDYILFMHDDAPAEHRGVGSDWASCIARLRETGAFQGGSSIGGGVCASKSPKGRAITRHLSGYIRIRAASLEAARELVVGNPVYEAGGTVEIRELPTSE